MRPVQDLKPYQSISLVILVALFVTCSKDPSTSSTQDVREAIPLFEGVWRVCDSLASCPLQQRQVIVQVRCYVDTLCPQLTTAGREFHFEIWDAFNEFRRVSGLRLVIDHCAGEVTDSTLTVNCEGGILNEPAICIPYVRFYSSGVGDSMQWVFKTTIREGGGGDTCQVPPYDPTCIIYKRVYTRIGDAPDPCPGDSS